MPIIHNYCITNKYFQFLDDLNINGFWQVPALKT